MLFGRYPDMAIAPFTQLTQLLHFGVLMLYIILDGQTRRIKDTHISTQTPKYTRALERQQARIRSISYQQRQQIKTDQITNLSRKLPYKTRILSLLPPVFARSASDIFNAVLSSDFAIQSLLVTCGLVINGLYFDLISASSSRSEIASVFPS